VTIETRIDERWRNPGTWFFDSIDNPIQILVFNYDGVIGDNFRVYFNEQSPDYVIDIASYGVEAPRNNAQFFEGIASPVWIPELRFLTPTPGLTNAESFARHRAAVLNEVAPTTDTTSHPEIIGITASLLGQEPPSFADTPTPFFWFQENRTTDLPSDFTILYKDFAVQGADAIHFRIDNGPPIIETDNDGVLQISDVPAGAHSVSAFLADSAGNEWANRVRFTIDVTESAPAVANFAGATQTATATQVLPVAEEEESQESQDQPTQLDERPHVAVTEFESAPMAGAGESDKSPFTSELIDALFADDDKLADVL
jgi:hypothetical protein